MITIKDIIEFVEENGEYEKSVLLPDIYKHTYTYTVDNYNVHYLEIDKVFSGTLMLYKNGVMVSSSNIISKTFCTDDELNEVLNKSNSIFEVIDYYYNKYIKESEKENNKKRFLNKFMGKE